MGCFVRGGKNGMGCFVRGDKNCMGCFVRGGKLMRDVLSRVAKNGMGCIVPGCFVLHSGQTHEQTQGRKIYMLELWFLYMTRRLNVLYKCMKSH